MGKKKSKTQKYKQNQKRKNQKTQKEAVQKTETVKNTTKNTNQLVTKDKVKYNVALTEPKILKNNQQKSKKQNKIKELFAKIKRKISENKVKKLELKKSKEKEKLKQARQEAKNNNYSNKNNNKSIQKKQPVKTKKAEDNKKRNIFIRLLIDLKNNSHIIFNSILIIIFIIMLIGLIRINTFKAGSIIYICCIVVFLMAVAISYNKYLSGKLFTIILSVAMGFAIYHMQYTYDFIRNLNTNVYEYKTYYVVTFDSSANRSIYNINNKKVGLLKENCINIERKLNTKLDSISYYEYEDMNLLFRDFFNREVRAILVNDNQYKYLKNNIEENSRPVKILYEFKVNAKK